jgi:hypothetical protein
MGRKLRYAPEGGALFEITDRTIQGRPLFRPSRELNEVVLGILGRAQRLYGVTCSILTETWPRREHSSDRLESHDLPPAP